MLSISLECNCLPKDHTNTLAATPGIAFSVNHAISAGVYIFCPPRILVAVTLISGLRLFVVELYLRQ